MINVGRDYFANKLICSTLQNIDHIQMGLDFGFNSYRGISDACPGVEFLPDPGSRHYSLCCLPGKPEKDQIFIIAIASGVIRDEHIYLQTINGEHVVCKLNCREDLTMSAAPLHLHIKKREEEDVGDVAIIKFIQSCRAVCEGLVLRKFLLWVVSHLFGLDHP